MKKGYVVVANGRNVLRCATYAYTHAIVVNLDPFVLVSEEGDMLWQTM